MLNTHIHHSKLSKINELAFEAWKRRRQFGTLVFAPTSSSHPYARAMFSHYVRTALIYVFIMFVILT